MDKRFGVHVTFVLRGTLGRTLSRLISVGYRNFQVILGVTSSLRPGFLELRHFIRSLPELKIFDRGRPVPIICIPAYIFVELDIVENGDPGM